MARYQDIDQAMKHVGAHASREESREFRKVCLLHMVGPVAETFGLELDALFEEVHEFGHAAAMIGFVDEATIVGARGADTPSILDDYLKRRGWQETPRAREYLQSLGSSTPTLWEVQSVQPGEWIELRDRLRDDPVVRITEHLASQSVQRWDCLIGRVLRVRDEHMLSGGTLTLSRGVADAIEDRLAKDPPESPDARAVVLLQMWLDGLLSAVRRPMPMLQNTEGEPMLFANARFKIAAANVAMIEQRLDALTGWTRDAPGEPAWSLSSAGGVTPATVLASVHIDRGHLVLETNSRGRMDRALASLQPALRDLAGQPVVTYEDPQVVMREHSASRGAEASDAEPGIQPAEMQAIVHRFKEQHYRKTLDELVPMLGDKTPRQCARSKAGRLKLVRWLKDLENGELLQAAQQGIAPMDFGWMWEELGLERE